MTVPQAAVAYLAAFGLTIVVEVPIYALLLQWWCGVAWARAAAAGILVNCVSHPIGFLVIAPLATPLIGNRGALAGVEVWAWIGEAAMLWLWLRRAPVVLLGFSLVANASSLAAGLTLLR